MISKERGSCLKVLLIILVVLGLAAYYLSQKLPDLAREYGTQAFESAASEALKNMQIPEDQKARLESLAKLISAKVKSGEIDLDKLKIIGETLFQSKTATLLETKLAESIVNSSTQFNEAEKQQYARTSSRFVFGVDEGKIAQSDVDRLRESFHKVIEARQNQKDKSDATKELPKAEIEGLFAEMKSVADNSGIEDRVYALDYSRLIQTDVQAAFEKVGVKLEL